MHLSVGDRVKTVWTAMEKKGSSVIILPCVHILAVGMWCESRENKLHCCTWKNRTRHFGVNKRTTTHITHIQQDSTTSDGLDPSALQKKERTSKSVMDFNSEKNLDLLGLTWDEALDLTKDRPEWRDCTARCAFTARGRTKV